MSTTVSIAAKVKITGKVNDLDENLIVAGIAYDSVSGFNKIDGIPTTLYLKNLVDWIGGIDPLVNFLPVAVRATVKTRLNTLISDNAL